MRGLPLAACVLALSAVTGMRAAESETAESDAHLLKSARVGTDGTALLDFFHKRSVTEVERGRIEAQIRQLGDPSYEMRQRASADLLARGPVAMRQLRDALHDPDPEIVRRAEECLRLLEYESEPSVTAAAARLLAVRKPAGAVEALLAYVPFATDDMVLDEVRTALGILALRDGKPERVLVEALTDKHALCRAAAGEALARGAAADLQPELRPLLRDSDPTVRQWVAGGLLEGKDKAGIPVLISLLTQLPREQAWRAEELLYRVAGDEGPGVPLGEDKAERRKCQDAWLKWWNDRGSRLDLAKIDLEQRTLGYTLVVGLDLRGRLNGRVMELGHDGKPRWEIDGLQYAIDARVIGHDRVLVTEYSGRAVTERTFKGEVLWRKQFDNNLFPISAQRLPNGHTFIACRNALVEVDREGKELTTIPRPAQDVLSAHKLRSGQYLVCTNTGSLLWLDAEGKQLRGVETDPVQIFGGGIEVTNNGHILVPQYRNSKVLEFDAEGKKLTEWAVPTPVHASRLPNGHLLVASITSPQIVELDQSGKEVWKYQTDLSRVLRARRR